MSLPQSKPAGVRAAVNWYQVGSEALTRGELDTAEHAFQQALAKDPSHANALYRLGEFAQSRHNSEAAEQLYRRALETRPGHAGARKRIEALTSSNRPRPQTVPAGPPRRPAGTGVVGVVRNYQQRIEQNLNRRSISVITYRVEQPGQKAGSALPVEMRGPELHGSIANGDWVELPQRWAPRRRPARVRNLTTGETVKFRRRGSHAHPLVRALGWLLAIVMVLWVLAIVAFVVAGMFGADFDQLIETARDAVKQAE